MNIKTFLLFISILCISSSLISAQPASPEYDKGWFSIAVGPGIPLDMSGSLTANFGRTTFWQFALQNTSDINVLGNAELTNASSLSVSYGLSGVHRIGRIAVSGGTGITFGLDKRESAPDEGRRFIAPALIGNIQLFITPIKEMGVGFDVFGNLNPQLSTLGIRMSLVIEGHK